jgi:hypothetical protein
MIIWHVMWVKRDPTIMVDQIGLKKKEPDASAKADVVVEAAVVAV